MIGGRQRLKKTGIFLLLAMLANTAWSGVSQDNIARGEEIYKKSCSSCHSDPKTGAPQITDKAAWEKRIEQPRQRLMKHVLRGFKKMPARGGDSSLNVHNVGDALDYMLFAILGLEDVIVDQSQAQKNAKAGPANKSSAKNAASSAAKSTNASPPTPSATASNSPNTVAAPATTSSTTSSAETNATPMATVLEPASAATDANTMTLDPPVLALTSPSMTQEVANQINAFISAQRQFKGANATLPADIPNDKYGDDVKLGYQIFTATADFASRYDGNDLSCSNCHLDAGRREFAAPMWGAIGMYPAYKQRNDRNNTLEDRIQQCFQFSLNGFAPSPDSPEIRALESYIHFISRGVPIGYNLPGRGLLTLQNTGFDPNPTRGLAIFEARCKACHQADGTGRRRANAKGYEIPPLWGRHAYNKAAGFYNSRKLAGFIKANMPPVGPALNNQEALDVAAYINQQIRPGDPRKGLFDAWFGD